MLQPIAQNIQYRGKIIHLLQPHFLKPKFYHIINKYKINGSTNNINILFSDMYHNHNL